MHDLAVITTLAGALAAALILGWVMRRLGLSPLVGYLLAGIAVGPNTPGFVADTRLAPQLAEIGVILLMFGVGLHFHPRDLFRVWRIAVPGAVAQSVAATVFGWAIALWFGWSSRAGLILGMALAVASTVVLLRMLGEQGRLATREGHIAVGWLIVEDLFTVVALVILPAMSGESISPHGLLVSVGLALGKVVLFAGIAWFLAPRVVSPLLEGIARSRLSEFFTLGVFVLALSVAAVAAEVFHVSVALGAFLGGLVVAQSRVGHQAAAEISPFRDVFSALFFVSIGMLFEPAFVVENPGLILAALGVVFVIKPLVALLLVLALRGSAAAAATVSIGLAQIGEFSFILGALGKSLGMLPEAGFNLLVATALISIAANPLLFRISPAIERRLARFVRQGSEHRPAAPTLVDAAPSVLLAGYGRTGRWIARGLGGSFGKVSVIDADLEAIDGATANGLNAIFGNAASDEVLLAAGIGAATVLIVALPHLSEKMAICLAARRLNRNIRLVALADNESEAAWLKEFGVDELIDLRSEVASLVRRRLQV